PWSLGGAGGWRLDSFLAAGLGAMEAEDGDRAGVGHVGLGLLVSRAGWPLALDFGTAPGFVSATRLGERSFGGHFQFTSHIGLQLALGSGWSLGLRLQHASNADIYDENEGQDFLAL